MTAILFIFILFMTSPSVANSGDLAEKLALLFASEKFCAFKYNQNNIKKYIKQNISEDDIRFPQELKFRLHSAKISLKMYKTSEKTAHCTQVERIARKLKFITK